MKTKMTSFMITFALIFCIFAGSENVAYAAAESAPPDNIVRVHLNSYGEPAQISMNAAGSYKISDNGKQISGAFTVSASGSGIKVTAGGISYDLDSDIYIKADSLAVSNLIRISGSYKYAGDMRIINKGGKLKLINYVDIEVYVMGVLPYEMSNGWAIEALKTQAVASRTYAYYVMNSRTRTSVEHDLVNMGAHQIYNGYNASNAQSIAAVNATKNTILKTGGGQIVYTCFSASNGGMTESGPVSGAAATNYNYLPVKEDPSDLAFSLASSAYSGKLSIPKTIAASDLKNKKTQPFKMIREKMQTEGVDVSAIQNDITIKKIQLKNARASDPNRIFTGAKFTIGIPNASDVAISFGPVSVSGSAAKYPFLNEILGLGDKFAMLALRDDGSSWLLASVRNGHGSGLSQIGAYQMALGGKTYQDILTFYYNLGSASRLVVMPWNNDGTGAGADGFTTTDVKKTGSVNTPGSSLNVRSGPGTGHGIVTSLKDKTKVTITGQVADWWRIDLGNGKTGFVSSAYVTLDKSSEDTPSAGNDNKPSNNKSKKATVNTPGTTLNVRSGPGSGYSILGGLKHGKTITVRKDKNGWYKLTFKGKPGYVSAAYVKLKNTNTTPSNTNNAKKEVYVNTPGLTLNVRDGAGTSHKVVGSLKHGEKIRVTGESGDWYKIKYNGKTGYISKAHTSKTDPTSKAGAPEEKSGTVNAKDGLNVRDGAGANDKIIGYLADKSKVTITDQSGDWYKIKYGTGAGWVSKTYVKV